MTLSTAIRNFVRERAKSRCEYCQTVEWIMGFPHELDHIVPQSRGGSDDVENLCLACASCNRYKQAKVEGDDPTTSQSAPLFDPRHQQWTNHFAWSENGTTINGLTACGRATVAALRLNNRLIISARAIWQQAGHHPP